MEDFARYEMLGDASGIDSSQVWPMVGSMLPVAQSNRDGFLTAVAETVTPVGGWAAYGASRLVAEVIDSDFEEETARVILDGAVTFLRQHGVPPQRLRTYEWLFWLSHGGSIDNWLTRLEPPPPDDTCITQLARGEVRRVAQLTAAHDSNTVHVGWSDDGTFVGVIDARRSDEDPTRGRWVWKNAGTMYELYMDMGLALQVPPFWVDPELEHYIPLPRPRI
ncbi:hypothetical protein [Micromonospora zhanjiangensis]|uniref:SUKH-3 immunity protein n=1 Tax=Micromonospora zhanjiangensis TaxID=1522057 RepID=A0ABV8KJP2_9ACTN